MFFHFRQGYYLLHAGCMEQLQEARIAADTMTYMRIILSSYKVDEQILLNSPDTPVAASLLSPSPEGYLVSLTGGNQSVPIETKS